MNHGIHGKNQEKAWALPFRAFRGKEGAYERVLVSYPKYLMQKAQDILPQRKKREERQGSF